jgi:hypothetical protein
MMATALLAAVVWFGFNNYLLPRVIVPEVFKQLAKANQNLPIDIYIRGLDYNPYQGFVFRDITLYVKQKKGRELLFKAASIDTDLDWLALCWKKVKITRFKVGGAALNIKRNKAGAWNFDSLLRIDRPATGTQEWAVELRKVEFQAAALNYADLASKQNELVRKFPKVDLAIDWEGKGRIAVDLKGEAVDPRQESFSARFQADAAKKSLVGSAAVKTAYLNDYWQYYLDDLCRPWRVKGRSVQAAVNFQVAGNAAALSGEVSLTGGALRNGDYRGQGNLTLGYQLKFNKGKVVVPATRLDLSADELAIFSGPNNLVKRGVLLARLQGPDLTIERFSGESFRGNFNLRGVIEDKKDELRLEGTLANCYAGVKLKMYEGGQAAADLLVTAESSRAQAELTFTDLRHLRFVSAVTGEVSLADFANLVDLKFELALPGLSQEVTQQDLRGKVILAGYLKGRLGEGKSLDGWLDLAFRDFTIKRAEARSFYLELKAKNGLFQAVIPQMPLYKGLFGGGLVFDPDHWGVELHFEDIDLAALGSTDQRFQGMVGKLEANGAFLAPWSDPTAIAGGGYFQLTDADLRPAPIFKIVEEGIASVNQGFTLPNFKSVEGNFAVGKKKFAVDGAYARAENLDLRVDGTYSFAGETDFTLGVKFSRGGTLKRVRQVLLPVTIGFDVLANSLQIDISGRWPDLQQKTAIKTLQWMDALFDPDLKYDRDKYTLKGIWAK